MRISFITPTLNVGGYEKVVIAYANELCRRDHAVDILCLQKTGDLIGTVCEGVRVIGLDVRARTLLLPLTKYLREFKPDILYCAFREINCVAVLAKLLTHVDTCIYATQHGFQTDPPFNAWVKGRVIGKADRLITVADGIADYESEALGIDRNRFIVFNNPVLDYSEPIEDGWHPWFDELDQVPIIVMAGRIAADKGKIWGVDILAELNKSCRVRMIYLGDGPELGAVKAHAEEMGVTGLVDFLGFVDNPMGYMRNCSLFLHTAIVEGFGNVVVEALNCNLPVCATDCSGPMQIIEYGRYGINLGQVNDYGFVQRSARAIKDIIENRIVFEGLKERAACFEVRRSTDQFLSYAKDN